MGIVSITLDGMPQLFTEGTIQPPRK